MFAVTVSREYDGIREAIYSQSDVDFETAADIVQRALVGTASANRTITYDGWMEVTGYYSDDDEPAIAVYVEGPAEAEDYQQLAELMAQMA